MGFLMFPVAVYCKWVLEDILLLHSSSLICWIRLYIMHLVFMPILL